MSRSLSLVLGGLLVVVGVIWTLQGLDVLGGSAMSGVTFWAFVGPLVALGGILLDRALAARGFVVVVTKGED